MLQQTQVATVVPYFERWMTRYPTLTALAAATEAEVLKSWQGLGYYSRARRLLEGARLVVRDHHGSLPRTAAELARLPGVGRYTAGAIASVAFGEPAPIVDGNVVRVLTRLEGLRGDPTRSPLRGRLWQLAEELVPHDAPGDFNQGMMELGATVCSPKHPRCEVCPLSAVCRAHAHGIETKLPELPPRPAPTPVAMAAAIVERDGRLLVVQSPDSAMRWAGLWMFPTIEHPGEEPSTEAAVRALRTLVGCDGIAVGRASVLRHAITRFRVTLTGVHCRLLPRARPRALGVEAVRWVNRPDLNDLALPTPQRRLASSL